MVRYFGIPISVIHDRDPRFTSDFWQSLWKLLGSHAIAISAHHPQADGQTECMNYTIGQILHEHLLDAEHMSTGLTMWLLLKWISILLSMLELTKHYLKLFMVKIFNCLLICYCLENPPSTLMLTHLLARCNSLLTRSKHAMNDT